jgi:hypothetical protein
VRPAITPIRLTMSIQSSILCHSPHISTF